MGAVSSATSRRPGRFGPYVSPQVSQDAVVVIPGIMGSTLKDTSTGAVLWGLHPSGYVDAWTRGHTLNALCLSDEERQGRYGRITATGLLRFPGWAPVLAGVEPYTDLVNGIHAVVADPAAVLEFAYDWRLPVEYNAALLATAANRHLAEWRTDDRHKRARGRRPDGRPAQLVLVAHSMGGLLVRAMAGLSGAMDDVRTVVTLGTPFMGAANAALILNSGLGAPVPLPRRRLRRLAATLPGVHDLLPTYRCIDTGDDVLRLSPSEVNRLGGNEQLARDAAGMHARTEGNHLPDHRLVIGEAQPTIQTLQIHNGLATGLAHTFEVHTDGELLRDEDGILLRHPATGDGTVPARSATTTAADRVRQPQPLPQQHGALAKTDEAITAVRAAVLDITYGGRLGDGEVGITVPDLVRPGVSWQVRVEGVDRHAATCTLYDIAEDRPIDTPPLHYRDGHVQATVTVPAPGLYRVQLEGASTSPVTQLVLAVDPNVVGDDWDGADLP
jgi:Lecithin:cholesterol acyltransferase